METVILLKQAETMGSGRVIGMDPQMLLDCGLQIISTVLLIAMIVMLVRFLTLGIKAFKLYIKKNG